MANPSDKQMLRDANGDLIPQYWDITVGNFKPLTGENGAQDTRVTGSIAEEYFDDINSISAGANIIITTDMKGDEYNLFIRWGSSRPSAFKVETWSQGVSGQLSGVIELGSDDSGGAFYRVVNQKTLSKTQRFRITNLGESSADIVVIALINF